MRREDSGPGGWRQGEGQTRTSHDPSPFGVVDVIGSVQRAVQPPHNGRDAVTRIQTLSRVRLPGRVRAGGDLTTGEIDRLQTGPHHLNGLATGQRAEGSDIQLRL